MKTWDQREIRRRFGAPFGLQARLGGSLVRECLVAIRNIQWQDVADQRVWTLGAGCGLVPQSVFENEWKELAAKRDSVCQLMGL
jgi:isochorismate synthase EntC